MVGELKQIFFGILQRLIQMIREFPGIISYRLKSKRISFGCFGKYRGCILFDFQRFHIFIDHSCEIQRRKNCSRRSLQKSHAFRIPQTVYMVIQSCHQQEYRKLFPEENLESTGEDANIFGVCYFIDRDQYPLFVLLNASEHTGQSFFDVCDRRSSFDSDTETEGLQIDFCFFKDFTQRQITVQFRSQCGE